VVPVWFAASSGLIKPCLMRRIEHVGDNLARDDEDVRRVGLKVHECVEERIRLDVLVLTSHVPAGIASIGTRLNLYVGGDLSCWGEDEDVVILLVPGV